MESRSMRPSVMTCLLLALSAPVEQISAQRVLDFTDVAGATWGHYTQVGFGGGFAGGTPYKGITFVGFGEFVGGTNAAMLGYGDGVATWMHSDTPFNFASALFKSVSGVSHSIFVVGFRETDRLPLVITACCNQPWSYSQGFSVDFHDYTQIDFGWVDVTSVAMFSSGGIDPRFGGTTYHFLADDITIIPEPGSLSLIVIGIAALVAVGAAAASRVGRQRPRSQPTPT